MENPPQIDWRQWMRAHGQQVRRLREFLGLSQEQLAQLAGVSQGAVSRLEAGRGLATPMLVVMKITLAVVRGLRALDPSVLNDDLRRLMNVETTISPPIGELGTRLEALTKDPGVEELISIYRDLPERQRPTFLSVMRATAAAFAPSAREENAKVG